MNLWSAGADNKWVPGGDPAAEDQHPANRDNYTNWRNY